MTRDRDPLPASVGADSAESAAADTSAATVWLAGPAARARFVAETQTAQDMVRWKEITNPRRREEWEVSRALLAHVREQVGSDATLSMSHSGGYAAVAASRVATRVGVDLEYVRERDVERLARFAFTDNECAQLDALPAETRPERFYILWTLKEAFAKALSLPLMTSLSRCTFVAERGAWRSSVPTSNAWAAQVFRPSPTLVLSAVALWPERVLPGNLSVLVKEWPEPAAQTWRLLATLRSLDA